MEVWVLSEKSERETEKRRGKYLWGRINNVGILHHWWFCKNKMEWGLNQTCQGRLEGENEGWGGNLFSSKSFQAKILSFCWWIDMFQKSHISILEMCCTGNRHWRRLSAECLLSVIVRKLTVRKMNVTHSCWLPRNVKWARSDCNLNWHLVARKINR